ncbi:head GIN domain-containing protein [Flavivirga abyssicola]|uniref:head GIN domain-containing protein n=1 Tax=Flavivirga abyssicola TaxID=3063533 RepID=UPI0026E0BD0F|nr:head GIN domain-containing protein [Flavivirga sp. MEBiC07777]WVK12890.1 head GIN domain-containing protein [Flavivirga sp. MEBiC07777]
MKTNRLYILLILLGFIISSCSVDTIRVDADDEVIYRNVYITDYSSIEIANGFTAYITFSDTEESIRIEANENLHDHIITSKRDDELIVRLRNHLNIRGRETLNVYITTKYINNFTATADSQIYLENTLIEDNAKIKVTADSFFSGHVDANYLELKTTADSNVDLSGSVNILNTYLSADAKLSSYDLEVEDLKIKMSADCNANLTVNKTIDIEAVADCTLRYKGNATVIYESLKADSRLIRIN